MSVNVDSRNWVQTLFIRDDGERFLLGGDNYPFDESQLHFAADTMSNDVIEVQGNNGSLLAGQVRRASTQEFDGFVGTFTNQPQEIEQMRLNFIHFFAQNHFYKVVYIMRDGTAMKRQQGYIVDSPEVKELYQMAPKYHVALSFENILYYSYNEDEEGEEIGNSQDLYQFNKYEAGGLVFDENGAVFDENGAVWSTGSNGGVQTVINRSDDAVAVIWTVDGLASNPILKNRTNDQQIAYNGTIADGSRLIVNTGSMTALLDGVNVVNNISGDWIELVSGTNELEYVATGAGFNTSTISWDEVIG